MTASKSRWAVVAIPLVVAAGVAVLSFVRTDRSQARTSQRDRAKYVASLVERGQQEYRTIPTVPLTGLKTLSDARALVANMVFAPSHVPRVGSKANLLDEIANFIYWRFANSSVDQYKAWRRASGVVLIPVEELRRVWKMQERYEDWFGAQLPEDATPELLFDKFWVAAPERSGEKWPVAIASTPKGLLASAGEFDYSMPHDRPPLAGEMQPDLWIGGYALGVHQWWSLPGGKDAVLAPELRKTECAEVGLLFACADGIRRPLILTFFWDQGRQHWVLMWANLCNYPIDKQMKLVF
jgi:hypothetical protein